MQSIALQHTRSVSHRNVFLYYYYVSLGYCYSYTRKERAFTTPHPLSLRRCVRWFYYGKLTRNAVQRYSNTVFSTPVGHEIFTSTTDRRYRIEKTGFPTIHALPRNRYRNSARRRYTALSRLDDSTKKSCLALPMWRRHLLDFECGKSYCRPDHPRYGVWVWVVCDKSVHIKIHTYVCNGISQEGDKR